mgnify:CR=1 FL=1
MHDDETYHKVDYMVHSEGFTVNCVVYGRCALFFFKVMLLML